MKSELSGASPSHLTNICGDCGFNKILPEDEECMSCGAPIYKPTQHKKQVSFDTVLIELVSERKTYNIGIPPERLFGPFRRYPFWGFFGKAKIEIVDEGIVVIGKKMRGGFVFFFITMLFIVAIFLLLLVKTMGIFIVFFLALSGIKGMEEIRKVNSEITIPFTSIIAVTSPNKKRYLGIAVSIKDKRVIQKFTFQTISDARDFCSTLTEKASLHTNTKDFYLSTEHNPARVTYGVVALCILSFLPFTLDYFSILHKLPDYFCIPHEFLTWPYMFFGEERISNFALLLSGKVWILVTTIFVHLNWISFLCHTSIFLVLAKKVERLHGSLYLMKLILIFGLSANVVQVLFFDNSPRELVAINYGLFAYIWMYGKYTFHPSFCISKPLMIFFIFFLFASEFMAIFSLENGIREFPWAVQTTFTIYMLIGLYWGIFIGFFLGILYVSWEQSRYYFNKILIIALLYTFFTVIAIQLNLEVLWLINYFVQIAFFILLYRFQPSLSHLNRNLENAPR
ncbi:rhomboid family intramembrane serine protease [Candidatus Uabimicrobium amorphum]|uniref:GlpG protein n=1 Tax=Uabimicrobium amorphum TaxID=2596890 RepID=A0A5S9IRW6_UABAM|nr:rhomboid family intramembrane serine protease [Candidatus Uabimicrobium amorphum]BBM86321.1 glpG protein [Candidatus Uabimicrobium amorphum]